MRELVQINTQLLIDKTEVLAKKNQEDMKALVNYVNENYPCDIELSRLLLAFLNSSQEFHGTLITYLSASQINDAMMKANVIGHGKDLDNFMKKWHPDV